jgi:hypothetical protein
MFPTSPIHSLKSESTDTIRNIVLKLPRACIIQSQGDGFGSYIERLINVAHETHRSFSNLIKTLDDLIKYIRDELEQTYSQYQFSIIIGKDFDYDQDLANPFALIEHTGMKILIFSSIGPSYKQITTKTNDMDDDKKLLSW